MRAPSFPVLPEANFALMVTALPHKTARTYVRRFGYLFLALKGDCAVERMLQKIAKQLCDFDEASLMELWERYARKVARFEPSREWEEAAIILTLIQGMRWKNQLFNHHWSESLKADSNPLPTDQLPVFSLHKPEDVGSRPSGTAPVASAGVDRQERGKVLSFRTVKDD